MSNSLKPSTVSFYTSKEDVQGKTKLWRPAKVSVNSSPETYKPYPLLMNLIMPNYPKIPLPQPWGVSAIRDVKLGMLFPRANNSHNFSAVIVCFKTNSTDLI